MLTGWVFNLRFEYDEKDTPPPPPPQKKKKKKKKKKKNLQKFKQTKEKRALVFGSKCVDKMMIT